MKTMRKLRVAGLFLLLIAAFSVPGKIQAQPGVNISFQTFYNDLSPYGRWTTSREYGSVWTPYVEPGFQPYSTNGYWEVTDYGNTWVSDYEWGWAPFHYGRWSYDDYNGWFWIPGYEWGPAWVNWRSGGDYYGWAPLGPGMNINVSINIPSFWWVFVPQRYISNRYWHNYCAPRTRVTQIYNQTTIINNYYSHNNRNYAYGPRRDEIERVTRRSVPVRQIDVNQRGRVITDRYDNRGYNGRSNETYSADRNNRPYDNNRQGNRDNNSDYRGRVYNENGNNDRNSGNRNYDNGRAERGNSSYDRNGSTPDPSINRRSQENYGNPGAQQQPSRDNRGSYDRPGQQAPASEPRAERTAPSYSNPENGRRSDQSADYGNQGNDRRGGEAPAIRQERSSSESRGSSQGNERSSQRNSGGNERSSDRGGRGPR
jgi:hypothetical protein